MAQSQELEAASRSSETYLAENGGGRPASVQTRSCIRVQEGTGQNYLGAHSRERLRHRQAPNDDDDDDDDVWSELTSHKITHCYSSVTKRDQLIALKSVYSLNSVCHSHEKVH